MTQPTTNTQPSRMDINRMLNPSAGNRDSSAGFFSGAGVEDKNNDEEKDQGGDVAHRMDLSSILNPSNSHLNSTSKDEEVNPTVKDKQISRDSSMDWNLDECKLPPPKMEMLQQPNDHGCYGSGECSKESSNALLLSVTPQDFHLRKTTPDPRRPRRSPSQSEPRGIQKRHRDLPTRSNLPQVRPNGGMNSEEVRLNTRTSPDRRRSCPNRELGASSADAGQHFKQPKPHKPPHSNKAYTPEQIDWIRYLKEDCKHKWKELPSLFALQFPGVYGYDSRTSDQCFSSRGYRDNRRPLTDKDWNPILNENGKVTWVEALVRERSTSEGMELDYPFTLVELHPERAVQYEWVSEEHKAMARRILISPPLVGSKYPGLPSMTLNKEC
ncbi:hypothetical protein LHYA1_G003424 [Lachnellula hyalina]|uniref:Uncharacterized protein n=1 Tax=Lachnellula hyalina TaxID=1316788 RepID=A0A8H8R508_9HELO|nr:uncharacterized protein LHYA1_G003424 [Lachnellula hyalina]TVY28463.1 hypothetical protein LHYA1_G003424 [Lachnellula hyalina]